ncbi:hypothetical protein DL96DRAFT_1702083 [Flagelloscypha sp. PMI_526]|nr:hypothetical protein DL96DRAFT_1702083 [Flagelloscypha sp. PMI_526]
MPRPAPLNNSATTSAYLPVRDGEITPRTPHSRSGRAEEAYTDIELDELRNEGSSDTQPLLQPSDGYRSHGDDFDSHEHARASQKSRLKALDLLRTRVGLVLGCVVAGVLLFLSVISYKAPETLHEYFGVTSNATAVNDTKSVEPEPTTLDAVVLPNETFSEVESSPSAAISTMPSMENDDSHIIDYSKWNYTDFPLSSLEYDHVCYEMVGAVMSGPAYWDVGKMGIMDTPHKDDPEKDKDKPFKERICSSSITYMLDKYTGLSQDLALLVQAAAMARDRNKTFFVLDTRWDRGKWSNYFLDVRDTQPGPEPGCLPPPPEELAPCPRLARHWVVTARTSRFHFGHKFEDKYANSYAEFLNRRHPIFNMGRESLHTTLQLNSEMKRLVGKTRKLLSSKLLEQHSTFHLPNLDTESSSEGQVSIEPENSDNNPSLLFGGTSYMSIHIRRGNKHSLWQEYNYSNVPLQNFADAVHKQWPNFYLRAHPNTTEVTIPDPIVYLASDDRQAIWNMTELFAKDTTFSLPTSGHADLASLASTAPYVQQEFEKLSVDERIRNTKGMVIDLAMLAGLWSDDGTLSEEEGGIAATLKPDAVVCTESSNVCRIAAMGFEWAQAFGNVSKYGDVEVDRARWIEVEDHNRVAPVWLPFEIVV